MIAVHLSTSASRLRQRAASSAGLAASGSTHEIVREDTYSTVVRADAGRKGLLHGVSRLRRGILTRRRSASAATSIALGHHRDDALETLLMNLFYAGKLQAMPAG